jgi:hypothetical protein
MALDCRHGGLCCGDAFAIGVRAMTDTLELCASVKPRIEHEEEKGQGRQVLTETPRVLTDSRRLPREDWIKVDGR